MVAKCDPKKLCSKKSRNREGYMRRILTLTLIVVVVALICLVPQPVAGKGTNMTNKPTLAGQSHGKLAPTAAQPHCHLATKATNASQPAHLCNHKATSGKVLVAKLHCKLRRALKLSDGPVIPPDPTDCPAYCGSACGCKDCDS